MKKRAGWGVVTSYTVLLLYGFHVFEIHYLRDLSWGLHGFIYFIVAAFAIYSINELRRRLGLMSSERQILQRQWRSFTRVTHAIFHAQGNKETLNRFASLIQEEMKVEWVRVFLFHGEVGRCVIGAPDSWTNEVMKLSDDLPQLMQAYKQPLDYEQVNHLLPDKEGVNGEVLFEASLVVGMFIQEKLAGLILLGPRKVRQSSSYFSFEKMGLQVLANQLAMVLEVTLLSLELRQSNVYHMKLLEVLLDQLGSGVIIVDPHGFVLVCNQEARRLMQWDKGENMPTSLAGLPQELSVALHQALMQTHDEELQESKILVSVGGEVELFIQFGCRCIHDETGKVLGAQLVFQDVSQVKNLEKQLHHANRLANLGALSASMVHEIKNPLVAIKTFVQLLPERMNDEEFLQKFSRLIGHEVGRIDQIVSQLLHLARPSAISFVSFHLHEVIEATLALYQPDLNHRKIKVRKELEAEVDFIRGDRQKIQQILMNLVVNAEEAMKQGGVLGIQTAVVKRLGVSRNSETKEGEAMRSYICLTIQDTGHGMMPKVLKRVFEPFYSTKQEGNGLGLSIVMGIMEDHQGAIEVQSELKQGTCFHLYFPLQSQESCV
ncbi:MAG: PAS domain-containing protein [Verrucomicrobiae bacterium]|nr:PAS domain-containing protein [Verrucomicrobiae bacterium]